MDIKYLIATKIKTFMYKLMFYWCWSSSEEAELQQQPLLEESTAMSYHDPQSLGIQKEQKGEETLQKKQEY